MKKNKPNNTKLNNVESFLRDAVFAAVDLAGCLEQFPLGSMAVMFNENQLKRSRSELEFVIGEDSTGTRKNFGLEAFAREVGPQVNLFTLVVTMGEGKNVYEEARHGEGQHFYICLISRFGNYHGCIQLCGFNEVGRRLGHSVLKQV